MSDPPQATVPVPSAWPPAHMAFEVRVTHDSEHTVRVTPAGELDIFTVGQLRLTLGEVASDPWRHLILDLRELTFADSSAVHLAHRIYADTVASARDFTLLTGGSARRVLGLAVDSTDRRRPQPDCTSAPMAPVTGQLTVGG
jgi:anti-anti-sigma factor